MVGRASEGLAPPCRNYREINPLSELEKLVESYVSCTTKEEVATISRDIGALKRTTLSLQVSIKSTHDELQKARELWKTRAGAEKKREGSSTEPVLKKRSGDVFEHVQEVFQYEESACNSCKSVDGGGDF